MPINSALEARDSRLKSSRLEFLLFSVDYCSFCFLFFCIFFYLGHVLGQRLIQERKRKIDVIESDNL